jgi:hypothetical protein
MSEILGEVVLYHILSFRDEGLGNGAGNTDMHPVCKEVDQ